MACHVEMDGLRWAKESRRDVRQRFRSRSLSHKEVGISLENQSVEAAMLETDVSVHRPVEHLRQQSADRIGRVFVDQRSLHQKRLHRSSPY
jgi:hypothetical protein